MTSHKVDNKKIAKNTVFLYFRMVLILAISFYTSRVVLIALGENDFGTYNVVGGLVVILSFLNSAMMGATQRYLNYELGTKNDQRLKNVFWTSLRIHFWIAGVVLVLAETVGLWFLNRYMNIDSNTIFAANVVYQSSVASFLFTVVTVPHNAAIIAHERMGVFAYISIVEAVLKLASALLLLVVPSHLLIYYAVFMMITSVVPRIMIYQHSVRHFAECRHSTDIEYSRPLTHELLSFSGWSAFGTLGYILHTQGIAIIINLFFSTIVNAAQGISTQVNTLVRGFSDNFLQAMKPQVIQTYAAGELEQMHKLIIRGCRLAIFLTAFFAIPIFIECGSLLTLWLKNVPEYTVIFVRIVLLISLLDSFSPILAAAQGATGKIKVYQVTLTTIGMFHLPFAAFFFWLKYPPQSAFYVYLVITIVLQVVRFGFVCHSVKLSRRKVFIQVILRSTAIIVLASILPALIRYFNEPSLLSTLIVLIASITSTAATFCFVGLTKDERQIVFTAVGNKIQKFRK